MRYVTTILFCLVCNVALAQGVKNIQQFPSANTLGGTELVPLWQNGRTAQTPLSTFQTFVNSNLASTTTLGSPAFIQAETGVTGVGMKPSLTTTFDNAPLIDTLMQAISPVGSVGDPGYPIAFPGIYGQLETDYYFSAPFVLYRSGTFSCGNAGNRNAQAVNLFFAPGVDGIVEEAGFVSKDGGWHNGDFRGCGIRSLGAGLGNTTNNSPTVSSASFLMGGTGTVNAGIPTPTYAIGDGLIVRDQNNSGVALAVPAGTKINNVAGTTLTLSQNANATITNAALYDLPSALAYSVTTTSGSNILTTTAGPGRFIVSGDLVWSDAFPFGCTVWSATPPGNTPTYVSTFTAQTIVMVDARQANIACNATATHAGGAGKLWVVPAGIKRRNGSHTSDNYIYGFPIGIQMSCASGGSPPANCTVSLDNKNTYERTIVGRWVAGNNTGASASIGETFIRSYRYSVMEAGSLGSTYIGTLGGADAGFVGLCGSTNYSTFIGTYENMGTPYNYCLTPTDLYNGAINSGQLYGASPLFIGSIASQPQDVSSLGGSGAPGGLLYGPWQFYSNNAGTSPACVTISGGDAATNGAAGNFNVQSDCGSQTDRFRWKYDSTNKMWSWIYFNNFAFENWPASGYTGYVGNSAGSFNYPQYPNGIMINGEDANLGSERLLDSRATKPAGTWQKQGDVTIQRSPAAGGTALWVDTANGANFKPAAPIANDASGTQWILNMVIMTSSTFSGLPTCTSGIKGGRQFITDGAATPTFSGTAAGGGSLFTPVYCDGTTWRNG